MRGEENGVDEGHRATAHAAIEVDLKQVAPIGHTAHQTQDDAVGLQQKLGVEVRRRSWNRGGRHPERADELLGETPLLEVPLPAGSQRLRLQNTEEGIDAVVEVDIVADRVTVKRLAL